jgi:hypothetical protein
MRTDAARQGVGLWPARRRDSLPPNQRRDALATVLFSMPIRNWGLVNGEWAATRYCQLPVNIHQEERTEP